MNEFIMNKMESAKNVLLKSMGIEPEDKRSAAEKAEEYLRIGFKNAKQEYNRALAFYNTAGADSVEFAIDYVNTCKMHLDCIIRQLKEFEEWINYDK